jgi:hypothetical protein
MQDEGAWLAIRKSKRDVGFEQQKKILIYFGQFNKVLPQGLQ